MGGLVGRPLELCGMLVGALGVSACDGLRFARFVRRISCGHYQGLRPARARA